MIQCSQTAVFVQFDAMLKSDPAIAVLLGRIQPHIPPLSKNGTSNKCSIGLDYTACRGMGAPCSGLW